MSLDILESTDTIFVGETVQKAMMKYRRAREPLAERNSARRQSSSIWWAVIDGGASKPSNDLTRTEPLNPILINSFIDRALGRLEEFSAYEEDWDGEGASAPLIDAIEGAVAFLQKLEPWHPRPVATVSSEGNAVIEFYDDGDNDDYWGSVTFYDHDTVEIYLSSVLRVDGDRFFVGKLSSGEALRILSNGLQITVRP